MAQVPWEKYQSASGPWERYGGEQVKPSPPGYGNLQPKSDVELQQSKLNLQKTAGTLAAEESTAKSQATKADIDARTAQEQWNITHPTANGAEALSGPAYMQQLQKTDPGRAAYIQGLAEGRVPFPGPQMMRSPAGMALLNQVMRADPTIDATNYQTRAAARKNAAVGTLSQSDNAIITAVGHAARLHSLVPEVFGTPSHLVNSVANAVQGDWMGGKQPTYDQNAQLLGDEVAKAYGGSAQGDREGAAGQFSSSLATKQKYDNIRGMIDLGLSKLAANRAQFAYGNNGLGKPDFMLLPENVRDELKQAGATDLAQKYFSGVPVMGANGTILPPGSNGGSGGLTAPPTGPGGGGGVALSNNGQSDKPDPQSAAFWEGAARQGAPYQDALAQWQKAMPAGSKIITPPDPDAYGKVVSYMRAHPNAEYHPFESISRSPTSDSGAAATAYADNSLGASALHAGDAFAAHFPTQLAGDEGAYFNAVSGQQHPTASMLGDVGGTILGMRGAGKIVGGAAPSLGAFGNIIGGNSARAALTGDSIFGAASGYNQNPDHPVLGAAEGLLAMGAGHGLGRFVLGPAAAAAGDSAAGQFIVNKGRSLGGLVSGKPPTPFAPPPAPEIPLSSATQKALPDITGKLEQAQSAGLPYMIADADPRLRAVLGSAGRFSPNVQAQAESILQPRQAGQGERAISQIGKNLAPVGDVPTLQEQLLKSAQAQSSPLYTAAKAQPVPDLTANPKLAEVLDRPAGQAAIRHGYETALNKGEDVGTLTYATDPQGNPVQYGNPSWNIIHYARQALDKSGDTEVRQALDKQIAGLNPGFKEADAKYSSIMKGSDALQAGSDATGIKVTPEATLAALNRAGPNAPQFQQGYASSMADKIEQQRFSGNPYNLVNGSIGQQSKLGAVFPQGATDFNTAHALESDMGKTYQGVLGNSMTQNKAMADKAFSLGDLADFGVDAGVAAATGNPAGLGMLFLRKGIDSAKYGMSRQKADAIAPFLMNTDPGANLANLHQWIQQDAARKAYLGQVRAGSGQVGAGLFGAPLIYGASQN